MRCHAPPRALRPGRRDVAALDARDKKTTAELAALVATQSSTLDGLCGVSTKDAVELLVETGDPRRFTEGGYARFNGTATIPASSGEGNGEPVRHRLDEGDTATHGGQLPGDRPEAPLAPPKLTADNNEHSARLRPANMLVSTALSPR
jgi:hypothetical protein